MATGNQEATKLICDSERQGDCLLIELCSIEKTHDLLTRSAGQRIHFFFMCSKGHKTVFDVERFFCHLFHILSPFAHGIN